MPPPAPTPGRSGARPAYNAQPLPNAPGQRRYGASCMTRQTRRGTALSKVADTNKLSIALRGKHHSHRVLDHGPYIKSGLGCEFFSLGQIIDVPHPVPTMDSNLLSTDETAVTSKLGPLTCKRRPAVVVAVYRDRCKVLPMYTHQKHGIANKPQHVQDLALWVMPNGAQTTAPSNRTLRCDQMPYGRNDGESTLYPTDSYCVEYSWPIGTKYHGHLDNQSTMRILQEYTWYQEAGALPIDRQAAYIKGKRQAAFG